ncbi:uncharacterized protein LOC123301188 [Chrysoperla carnea]|uniref:uncharacterized protein LOC123301188 n=1 Tax=Chrysoperla carnea TaxID=189513 RepID=UPI001D06C3FB|nr:uncharacterized protein LOC123301188 [Chrysoperla carnea]
MRLIIITIILIICISNVFSRRIDKNMKKIQKELKQIQERETTPVKFVTLVAMRLIYGIASTMGLSENLSGVLNGAFVPPGVDDYSDYGEGFDLIGDDDY